MNLELDINTLKMNYLKSTKKIVDKMDSNFQLMQLGGFDKLLLEQLLIKLERLEFPFIWWKLLIS